jgi:pimeloyl-ACP methyl ester carboxylesterase
MAGGAVARPAAPVGVRSLTIVDTARPDPMHPSEPRTWSVDVYYPAARAAPALPYAPDAALIGKMTAEGYYDVPAATLQGWLAKPGPASAEAPPAPGARPLVTISPGSGLAAFNYSILAAALVRRGYAVVVVDHPYIGVSRLPDGRFMTASEGPSLSEDDPKAWRPAVRDWARDVSVTLDRLLTGGVRGLRLDPSRVTVTGHSLGGTIALQVCADDARPNGCGDFEGAPEASTVFDTGPRKPSFMTAARSAKPDRPFNTPALDKPPFDFLARGGGRDGWAIAIQGGSHMSYSDAPSEMPDTLSRFGGTLMSAERSYALYAGLVDAFARAYAPGGGGSQRFAAFLRGAPEVKARSSGGQVVEPAAAHAPGLR